MGTVRLQALCFFQEALDWLTKFEGFEKRLKGI